jgi:hypothetical protein
VKRDRVTLCLFCRGAGCRYCQDEPTPPRSKAKPAMAPFVAPAPIHAPDPTCRFCGGDPSAPNHERTCDGRQGGRDDAIKLQRHRETSVQAFYNAVDAGTIKTKQQQVWAALVAIKAATINEVVRYLNSHANAHVLSPRFAELRDLGLIREAGERPCHVTNQNCIVWESVPSSEHRGVTIVNRCPRCNQIVSRDLRSVKPEGGNTWRSPIAETPGP